MSRLPHYILLILSFSFSQSNFAQPNWDDQIFRSLSPSERYRFVHDYPFWKITDINQLASLLENMLIIAKEADDTQAIFAIKYYIYYSHNLPGFKIPFDQHIEVFIKNYEAETQNSPYEVEKVVSQYFLAPTIFHKNPVTYQEQQYIQHLQTFDKMQAIGFEAFDDYCTECILYELAKFMWELEDYEKAFEYLSVAEEHIQADNEGALFYTLVNNYLQSYWKQKKDYKKSFDYAKKILSFHENAQLSIPPHSHWWISFWKGFSNLEMAALLIEQGNYEEGEIYANKGYQLSIANETKDTLYAYQSEYDALQVLIPIKLKLKKLDEAKFLLNRALKIKEFLENRRRFDHFKPLKLYQHLSKYYEATGKAATSLHYTRLAQTLQDSLNIRNDTRKIAKIQQRLEIEKYTKKLQLVEHEKEVQKLLRNAVIIILALVILIAFINYRRLQYKRLQKETALKIARKELELLTQSFREKSELVENLRLENEKLSKQDKRLEYLEQLSNATILTETDWTQFKNLFEKVHPGFIRNQKQRFPNLTHAETRLLVLDKLELSTAEMANMLGVNKNTIHQTRRRLRKKTSI